MAYAVFDTAPGTSFICPACLETVHVAVVAPLSQVFTAPAMALHRGLGHTVALVGKRLSIRCGDDRVLLSLAARLHADGRITDATCSDHAKAVADPKVVARKG